MCRLEGLRVQAPGLQKRRVNIRKDVLCYRLAASEVSLATAGVPVFGLASSDTPDSARHRFPELVHLQRGTQKCEASISKGLDVERREHCMGSHSC